MTRNGRQVDIQRNHWDWHHHVWRANTAPAGNDLSDLGANAGWTIYRGADNFKVPANGADLSTVAGTCISNTLSTDRLTGPMCSTGKAFTAPAENTVTFLATPAFLPAFSTNAITLTGIRLASRRPLATRDNRIACCSSITVPEGIRSYHRRTC